MTVIFQLFCVDDLRRMFEKDAQRAKDDLIKIIDKHVHNKQLILEAKNNPDLKEPNETPDQILKEFQKRYREVTEQLQSPLPKSPSDPPKLEPDRSILHSLKESHRQLAPPDENDKELIIEWAISCEVNHYNFYNPLLKIKEEAYALFREMTGEERPKGPDSYYSPFYPFHPLYDLFADLKLKRPEGHKDADLA